MVFYFYGFLFLWFFIFMVFYFYGFLVGILLIFIGVIILQLCTIKTPTLWAVMSVQCDTDCAMV
jgi:hypothetical protein